MIKYLLICFSLFFIFSTAALADFYKWEDDQGNIHITDYPPPSKPGKKLRVYNYDSFAENEEKQESDVKPEVIIYTKDSCGDCNKAREFLQSKNIPFTEYNIDTDKEAAKKRRAIDDSEDVPFAVIGQNQVYGFSDSIYKRLLKLKP